LDRSDAPVDLGPVSRFPPGEITIVTAAGREIGVVRHDSQLFALRNVCPHQSGPLCRGKLTYQLGSTEPGNLRFQPDRLVVTCPWHGWEFDVESGRALYDASMRVAIYAVEVVDDRVLVHMGRAVAPGNSGNSQAHQNE
jgi:nitrite reductase/ring-hydroxylating ferredoxin subunit